MTAKTNQKMLGISGAVLCGLQLVDVPGLWRAGHPLAAVLISLAAVAGTVLGIWNVIRSGAEAAAEAQGAGNRWNMRINATFFCYFFATIVVALINPLGPRSLSGIVGGMGILATVFVAVRAWRSRRPLA
jgi:hypothetical protein